MTDELRAAHKLTLSSQTLREIVQERYSDMRGVDFAVERADWTNAGDVVLWITEPAKADPDPERTF